MQPCACGVAHDDKLGTCPITESESTMSNALLDSSLDETVSSQDAGSIPIENEAKSTDEPQSSSTLIEFPGVTRTVPEWRKQLSQRVREVQERRAREAAEAAAIQLTAESVSCALPSAQLELVPDREQPAMKPIVSKALERLERARQAESAPAAAAAATLAPVTNESLETESTIANESDAKASRKSKLVVVSALSHGEKQKKPVRVIADGIEDAALSYFETCLSLPAIESDVPNNRAGLMRRISAGLLDLLLLASLVGLCAAAIRFAGGDWWEPRVIGLISGIAFVLVFSYLTLSIALTGRTLGMRMLSLRTIDKRTGMIPTGGQSTKRALGYTVSLAVFGLGFLYALIDPEGRTVHDRFSKTMVIHD